MIRLLAALAWAGTIIWLLARAVRQHRAYESVEPSPPPQDGPHIAVIVPARDEAPRIARCLGGLLAQDYPPDRLSLVVVDDHSRDGTAAIVRRFARDDPRVRPIEAEPLPEGWAGKPWACWLGVRAAGAAQWLCFIDADVAPQAALLSSALAEARRRGLDMLSLSPFQELGTPGERLLLPAGFLFLAVAEDVRLVNDPAAPEASANGQFILIRRATYEALGGHAAVAGEVSEDSALARLAKRNGCRYAFLGGERLLACRMYCDFAALWTGLARNTTDAVGGVRVAVAAAFGGAGFALAAPLLPLWTARAVAANGAGAVDWTAFGAALAGSLVLLGTHLAAARHFRIPLVYGLIFPLGYLLGAALLIDSARRRRSGRVAWKGRVYLLDERPRGDGAISRALPEQERHDG